MRKSILAITLASTAALGACASNPRVAQDAGIGAVGGAAVGAVVPGVSVLQGAAVGAAIGGLAGAVWADRNNDGMVDGYVYNGQYYAGAPSAAPAPPGTAEAWSCPAIRKCRPHIGCPGAHRPLIRSRSCAQPRSGPES